MKVYSNNDPNLKLVSGVSERVKLAESMNLPYWVFVEDSHIMGTMTVGKEPMWLLASPGTPLALIQIVDIEQPESMLTDFVAEALKLLVQNDVDYGLVDLAFDETKAADQFTRAGFRELDDSFEMVLELDRDFEPLIDLQFRQAKREEMRKWLQLLTEFFIGSPERYLATMIKHVSEMPDEYLDTAYSLQKYFFAARDQQMVGVLHLDPKQGTISSIGVDPQQRGKDYGRQIALFGLIQLKESGCRRANLRVNANNKPAISLYESLGFAVTDRRKVLIWKKDF